MPTSFWNHIPTVIDKVRKLNPERVLECGVGFGKWGHLIREYCEVYNYLRTDKKDWKVRIDGIEIYEPYINPSTRWLYDNIYIGNIIEVFDKVKDNKYDLILLMDVLEHLTKQEGSILLNKLIDNSKMFILSIPLGDWTYEFSGENKHESHISIWNLDELVKLPNYKSHIIYPVDNKEIGLIIYEK